MHIAHQKTGLEHIDYFAQLMVVAEGIPLDYSPWSELHLLHQRSSPNITHIVRAYKLAYFNICTVERAERYCSVHHKLHVACSRSFHAGSRNLLADIGGGVNMTLFASDTLKLGRNTTLILRDSTGSLFILSASLKVRRMIDFA